MTRTPAREHRPRFDDSTPATEHRPLIASDDTSAHATDRGPDAPDERTPFYTYSRDTLTSARSRSSAEVDDGGEGDAVANIDGGMGRQDGTTGETNKRTVTVSFDYELTTSSPLDDDILASFEGTLMSDLADRFGLLDDCADDRRRGRKGRRRGTVEVGHYDDDGSIQPEDDDVDEADFDHDNEEEGGGVLRIRRTRGVPALPRG